MTGRLLLDLTHTSHTRARTGIQRVARALHRELGDRALPVTLDPHLGGWRALEDWEKANLASDAPAAKRGAHWPLGARLRGRLRRAAGQRHAFSPPADCRGFLTAEIFTSSVAMQLPGTTPRVAIFHDAIALQYPELSPRGTVARFPSYLVELLAFDGVAAVSEDSRDALLDYWRWLGVSRTPPVIALPLGVDPIATAKGNPQPAAESPVVLCVGTLEGRKNHLALLDACDRLWERGDKFTLRLVGSLQAETGQDALARIKFLQSAGRPLRYDGALPDEALAEAYAESAFTVYPSIAEGFGLPVIESLAHGRPCICSARGALGELSRFGGCLPLDRVDPVTLSEAIGALLASPARLAELSAAARRRQFKSWSTYTAELEAWIESVRKK
jgi:glycosyltransferase involved in cell wall biosynthesis